MVYLVYSIDNCIYCDMAKDLLQNDDKVIINCSKIVANRNERDKFIKSINKQVGYNLIDDKIYFPIIFLDDIYIGGYDGLKKHFEMKEIIKDYYIFDDFEYDF